MMARRRLWRLDHPRYPESPTSPHPRRMIRWCPTCRRRHPRRHPRHQILWWPRRRQRRKLYKIQSINMYVLCVLDRQIVIQTGRQTIDRRQWIWITATQKRKRKWTYRRPTLARCSSPIGWFCCALIGRFGSEFYAESVALKYMENQMFLLQIIHTGYFRNQPPRKPHPTHPTHTADGRRSGDIEAISYKAIN